MQHRWRRLRSEPRGDYRIFRVHEVTLERSAIVAGTPSLPDVQAFVLDCPDWVNVVPLTREGGVVLIRQYRFGTDSLTLEIPGGVIDPGEDPRDAALRELREETGHDSDRVELLGRVAPNPAIQGNTCHMFVAHGCVAGLELAFDEHEDIDVEVVTRAEAVRLVREGRVSHALAQVALLRALLDTGP